MSEILYLPYRAYLTVPINTGHETNAGCGTAASRLYGMVQCSIVQSNAVPCSVFWSGGRHVLLGKVSGHFISPRFVSSCLFSSRVFLEWNGVGRYAGCILDSGRAGLGWAKLGWREGEGEREEGRYATVCYGMLFYGGVE